MSSASVNAKTGSSSPRVSSSKGAELADPLRKAHRDVAGITLHPAVPVEAEAEEVVVLGDDLRAGPREVSAKVGMLSPR